MGLLSILASLYNIFTPHDKLSTENVSFKSSWFNSKSRVYVMKAHNTVELRDCTYAAVNTNNIIFSTQTNWDLRSINKIIIILVSLPPTN
jgi:hypothetical protein